MNLIPFAAIFAVSFAYEIFYRVRLARARAGLLKLKKERAILFSLVSLLMGLLFIDPLRAY